MSAPGGDGQHTPGTGDRLRGLADRLEGLDAEPVAAHPQVLEDVHRGLVAELDALAGSASSRRSGRG